MLLNPQTTYNFCKVLAALIVIATFFIFLRNELPAKLRIILIFFSLALISPLAEITTKLAAGSQGRSYTGALMAQILGIFFFIKITNPNRQQRLRIWNLFSIASGLVYATLRVGCHFRGCCWGKICGFGWAIYYRNPSVVTPQLFLPLHPVQLYSVAHGLITAAIVWQFVKRFPDRNALGLFLVLMGTGRLITDWFRADASFYRQSLLGHDPNTILSVLLSLAGVAALVVTRTRPPH